MSLEKVYYRWEVIPKDDVPEEGIPMGLVARSRDREMTARLEHGT